MGNSQSGDRPKSPSVNSTQRPPERKEGQRESSRYRTGANGGQHISIAQQRKAPSIRSHHDANTPPTTSLVPSSSTASTSTSTAHAHATTVSASPASSHSRARSITSSSAPTTRTDESLSHRSSPMGNAESRLRPPSRSSTLPPPDSAKAQPSPSSEPVDVPGHAHHDGLDEKEAAPSSVTSPPYGLPASEFSRPPRLPLPIERDPEPPSPLATPQEANTPMEQNEEDVDIAQRPPSMLSSTTLDEEEPADVEKFTLDSDPSVQKVVTTLVWRGHARAVYVTGTFVSWEKKFRMQKTGLEDGVPVFTLTAPLPTGTHHLRFLVDGEMAFSEAYPQTVDFTGSLVNYVEIAASIPPAEAQGPAPAEPMPIPGAAVSDEPSDEQTGHHLNDAPASETKNELSSTLHEAVAQAPSPEKPAQPLPPTKQPQSQHDQVQQKPQKKKLPRPKYTSEIPEFLVHLDTYNDPDDERWQRASKAMQHLPQPPSLPMFMSKSILNATTPHKDDASVLTMPNHTILNHLATSSIRNGVLATSGTTRYKRKFLTTIMYKPTSDDG